MRIGGVVCRHGNASEGTPFGCTQRCFAFGGHRRKEVRGSTDSAVSGSVGHRLCLYTTNGFRWRWSGRKGEGGSLVCCVVLMIMALTQTFSPSVSHISTLFRCTLPCAFDPRRLVLNITMHRIIFMACNETAIEFIELVAWPLERMGFD